MMDTIKKLRDKARAGLKTIVLPEYGDERVVMAHKIIESEKIAKTILLKEDKIDLKQKARYIKEFYFMHKAKGIDMDMANRLFNDPLYYAAMMVREGQADGLVAGAVHTTPDMARAVIRCLGVDERISVVSSCFIMVVPDCAYGEEGTFIFSDCGIIPEPNSRQLACISLSAAKMAQKVLGITARIALLSYSTKGSAKIKSIEKITEALKLAKEISPDLLIDGELQVDAAIVPEVAKVKLTESPVAGKANVLIFPDLGAGNIGYKLVQRLAKARAIGPLFLGLKKPASDLSRGCLVEDIVDSVAVTAIRAQ